jgi:hypothetical protein
MNIFEALKELDNGKAVRRKDARFVYFTLNCSHIKKPSIRWTTKDSYDKGDVENAMTKSCLDREEIEANDWQIYTRPKA